MAEHEITEVSPEAFERVKRERDELKTEIAQATAALADVRQRDRFYEHLRGKGLPDPYGLATSAVSVVTLKDLPEEQIPQRLDDWLEQQRQLLSVPVPPDAEESAPPKPSPFVVNPGAQGYQAKGEPMLVGSPRWREWARDKSGADQVAAIRKGDAVVSDTIKRNQGTARRTP